MVLTPDCVPCSPYPMIYVRETKLAVLGPAVKAQRPRGKSLLLGKWKTSKGLASRGTRDPTEWQTACSGFRGSGRAGRGYARDGSPLAVLHPGNSSCALQQEAFSASGPELVTSREPVGDETLRPIEGSQSDKGQVLNCLLIRYLLGT